MPEVRAQRIEERSDEPSQWRVLAVVALGGMLGAAARYGLERTWPAPGDRWPWATLFVNASGCLLIGVLMAWVETGRAHRLARPFFGVGLLGGYTTFSTYAVQTGELWAHGRVEIGALYLVATPVMALACVILGARSARHLIGSRTAGEPMTS